MTKDIQAPVTNEKALGVWTDIADALGSEEEYTSEQVRACVSAISIALEEAVREERREIMNLLGYDDNGVGLISTSSWLMSSETEPEPKEITICHDPYYNLEGALIDLRRQGADKVCISTIEKVQAQLAAVSKRASQLLKGTEDA